MTAGGPPTSPSIVNPPSLHDPVGFGYSHLALASDLVFVAGQYDSGPDGSVTTADFDQQVERAFENLGRALAAVDREFRHVVRLGTYVVDLDTEKLAGLGRVVGRIWGDRPPTQTLLGVAGLALPGMRFEVDAVAVRD